MSEDAAIYADPAEVVRRFIADMHAWESRVLLDYESSKPLDLEAFWNRARSSLSEVFARWCTPKERHYGRLGSFSRPPEYQPEHEAVLETTIESPRRACVCTQQTTGFRQKRKYTLIKKSNRWLLDSVKWWDEITGKWKAGTL